ncbi:unnamed protein product [Allacma fusca]|uniref:BTB domain-containing protein n=1 Tax=Allacma fusca TaxID=39272 RepID=A0A8J2KQY4_9HEXA|nr:unnamed protein product [Allacma fusca]
MNDFLDSLEINEPASVGEQFENRHALGKTVGKSEKKLSCRNEMGLSGGVSGGNDAESEGSIELEKEQLYAEIKTLTCQLTHQENTIKDDQEIINVLSDTIKIMTQYIAKLERQQWQGRREDSFNIFSPSKATPTVIGTASSSEDLSEWSNDLETKFCSVETEIAVLLRAFQKLKINHRRNGHSSRETPECNSEIPLNSLMSNSDYLKVPYTYRETEFVCSNGILADACQVIEHERLTAFSAVNMYQIIESSGVYTLYLQDNNRSDTKSFFKFQNMCPMSISGVTYDINVLFERTYDREWGDVMSLRVCFPGIWDCTINPDADLFVDRCLVVLTLLVDTGNKPALKKYYVLHGIKSHNEPSHDHKSKTDCARGSEEIFDANFCPFHLLQTTGLDYVTRSTDEKLWDCCAIEMKVCQLKYRNCPDESNIYGNIVLTQEEKYNYFKSRSHVGCSKVVFRIVADQGDLSEIESCDCIMMNFSPLFKEILQATNYCCTPCEEIEVRNTSEDTFTAILNYLHGVHNGSSWRRNVQLNLEVLGFAHEYFIPELAQLSTYNLLTIPDHCYTLDLVLKLQFLAKKLRNASLENRALQWI